MHILIVVIVIILLMYNLQSILINIWLFIIHTINSRSENNGERIRVRYAPSPTGYLHIGNARTALFNYLFAKHYNGDFVVRIEDTDSKRNLEDGESSQFDNLKWLGLDWDESVDKDKGFGPYRQSERAEIYNPLIQQLLEEDKAYKCYMTEEELEAEREAQIARGEMPRYGGQHAHLTEEQRQQYEAEGVNHQFVSVCLKIKHILSMTWLKEKFPLNLTISETG